MLFFELLVPGFEALILGFASAVQSFPLVRPGGFFDGCHKRTVWIVALFVAYNTTVVIVKIMCFAMNANPSHDRSSLMPKNTINLIF